MANELQTAFNEIAQMRALPPDVVLEALQTALVSAYRRDSGASNAQAIEAQIDPTTGRARIFVEKEVTEDVISPTTEVTLEKARFYEPEAQLGDTVMVQVEHTTKKFGRIAAQTAKQVILQKIREAERDSLYEEYSAREGDLLTGTVQSMNSSVVTLSLGRAEAILPRAQQIPGERYRQHEKLRVYLMEVKKTNRGPNIVCSRSHRNMLRRLLEYEVPEIYNGQVEIKSIAREAGYRSKVAVAALQEGIDPVGACVGMRGIRIQNIVKELHDEKIDVIEWNANAEEFISKALSPARVTGVFLDDDFYEGRTAVVVVPDDQLSLAIGREGQNARLAAKLTGWRIDIKSVTETVESALENIDLPPLDQVAMNHPLLVSDALLILEKKAENKAIMPEDYTKLNKLAVYVERALQKQREELRAAEREQRDAVRVTLPQEMFSVPLDALPLHQSMLDALAPLENIGEVMVAMLVDDNRVRDLIRPLPDETEQLMADIQGALDMLMEADIDFADLIPVEEGAEDAVEAGEAVAEAETEAEVVAEVREDEAPPVPDPEQPSEAATATADVPVSDVPPLPVEDAEAAAQPDAEDEEEEVVLDAFGGVLEPEQPEPEPELAEDEIDYSQYDEYDEMFPADLAEDDEDAEADDEDTARARKKGKRKRRRLVFDEETGEVVAKRRRKSNRKREDWDNFEF